MEPPPPHLRQAKFKAAPPAHVAETFDVDWLRELISHALLTAHASRLASGDFKAYPKIFYRVTFGLAVTERPEPLTMNDLDAGQYRSLYDTRWWKTFSSTLPILLRHFMPLIFNRMGFRHDIPLLNTKGCEALSYVTVTLEATEPTAVFHSQVERMRRFLKILRLGRAEFLKEDFTIGTRTWTKEQVAEDLRLHFVDQEGWDAGIAIVDNFLLRLMNFV